MDASAFDDPPNPAATRLRQLRENMARWGEDRARKAVTPRRAGATRFSTDYAIAWARSRGGRLIDRERYDARTKRHHDVMLAADALLEDADGMFLVQGAGRGERLSHLRRFEAAGGAEVARRRHIRFFYLEFERTLGPEPVVLEQWA